MNSEPSSPLTPTVPSATLPVNLYVANLPLTWSEDTFRGHFTQFGAIESAKILTDSSLKRSRGVGFLQFAQHQHALAAITAMDGQVAGEDGIQQQQQQQEGEQTTKPLIVKFATPKAANPAGPATPKATPNKALLHSQSPRTPRKQLTIPSSPTASSASSTTSSVSSTTSSSSSADHNLYVAGFPSSYTREDVSRLLSTFGPLASLRLLPPSPGANDSRKGERRGGVAFARFVCIEDGDRCIAAMDGQPLEGGNRGLQVRYANRGGRMNGQLLGGVPALDGGMAAVDYSAYAGFYNMSSPYAAAPYDYPSQMLLSPTYGYSAASDMMCPTYASYPYGVMDSMYSGASSYFYPTNTDAGTASTAAGLTSPATFTAFSFPSPTTASMTYPITPSHAAAALSTASPHSSGPATANSSLFPAHLSLFLCHLPLHWSEANLLSLCNPFGHLTSARIVRDRDGGSRGYGFVAFDQTDDAARAREALDGRKVDGRLVKVQWKDGRISRVATNGGVEGMAAEAAMYAGLLSPTSAAMMGLAVVA